MQTVRKGLSSVGSMLGLGSRRRSPTPGDVTFSNINPPAKANAAPQAAAGEEAKPAAAGQAQPKPELPHHYESDIGTANDAFVSRFVEMHHDGIDGLKEKYDTRGVKIGQGGCGCVSIVHRQDTGDAFAMKTISLARAQCSTPRASLACMPLYMVCVQGCCFCLPVQHADDRHNIGRAGQSRPAHHANSAPSSHDVGCHCRVPPKQTSAPPSCDRRSKCSARCVAAARCRRRPLSPPPAVAAARISNRPLRRPLTRARRLAREPTCHDGSAAREPTCHTRGTAAPQHGVRPPTTEPMEGARD